MKYLNSSKYSILVLLLNFVPTVLLYSVGTVFRGNSLITTTADLHFLTSVTSLASDAFRQCTALRIIDLPNNITSCAGNYNFAQNHALEEIVSLGGLTSLTPYFFYNSGYVTQIIIPEGIVSIGDRSFGESGLSAEANKLSYIDLPSTVTTIGQYICIYRKITAFVCRAVTPPSLGQRPFYMGTISKIYVPAASVDAYKAATTWKDSASKIVQIEGTIYER